MKPFETLTRLGRLRRMRLVAQAAIEEYGLEADRILFLRHAGNTVFRIVGAGHRDNSGHRDEACARKASCRPRDRRDSRDLFTTGQYLLRIHQPGYQATDAIGLELKWLAALRRDAGAPVPEPVSTSKGRLLTKVSIPGVPGARHCSLLKWVKGRRVGAGAGVRHYRAQGRLMAELHNHAAGWRPPKDHSKRRYDWNGLFRDDAGSGIPAEDAWALMPAAHVKFFRAVAGRVKKVMAAWGEGPDVYGLIHGDLGVDANVLFHRGEARAIDFDDSGTGYWIYDLAVALEHCREDRAYSQYREALLDGYRERRPLPEEQARHLELFLVAFQVYWSLWAAAMVHLHPGHRESLRGRMKRAARLVRHYLQGR
ncbi:MAG: phosphotransferase [bacterium]|jgi:Ser/Thr protein kinase RdoA (MazF antagonist)